MIVKLASHLTYIQYLMFEHKILGKKNLEAKIGVIILLRMPIIKCFNDFNKKKMKITPSTLGRLHLIPTNY